MKKKIILSNVNTEEDNFKIIKYLREFLLDNYQNYKDIDIQIIDEDEK